VRRGDQALALTAGFSLPEVLRHATLFCGAQHLQALRCGGCRLQTSLNAGTLMEHTKLPLTTWFLAIHLISPAKTGIKARLL